MSDTISPRKPSLRLLAGHELRDMLGELARLRIAVFAEWPYLYDGDAAYEAEYLAAFAAAPAATLVAAFDGERLVGAATASPLAAQEAELTAPFAAQGRDPAGFCYFGESVLLPAYRGLGLGHAFFDAREDAARAHGFARACFASVVRADDHPARPAGARALDPFWRRRGYAPVAGLVVHMAWKEHGEPDESAKPLQIWERAL